MSSWKQNIPGLSLRNMRISLRDSYFGFHNFLYYLQLCKIYNLVLIGELSHRHAINKFGKNLCLYLPIEA